MVDQTHGKSIDLARQVQNSQAERMKLAEIGIVISDQYWLKFRMILQNAPIMNGGYHPDRIMPDGT
jgi:hypothetical protein